MEQLFFILLNLLLNVLFVVLDVDELISHLTHDLGMLSICVGAATRHTSILGQQL